MLRKQENRSENIYCSDRKTDCKNDWKIGQERKLLRMENINGNG